MEPLTIYLTGCAIALLFGLLVITFTSGDCTIESPSCIGLVTFLSLFSFLSLLVYILLMLRGYMETLGENTNGNV